MLSAPATIPATSAGTFNAAFAPADPPTLTQSSTSPARPACSANAIVGARPPADTRLGSSKSAEML